MRQRPFADSLLHWRSSDDLVVEQYRSLRPQVPTMYVAVFLNIIFLAFVMSRSAGAIAFAVPLVMAILIAGRLVIWQRARLRGVGVSIAGMRASMTITVVVAGVAALGLSLWSQYILFFGDDGSRAYVALFTALCTISCAACLSSLPLAAYIVLAVGTVPVSAELMLTGDILLASMGFNLLLISPLIIGMIYRQYRQLRRMVASRSDIAAEKLKVGELAYRDSLTGLANRRWFLDELKAAVTGVQSATLAIGMIDLDGFKIINDAYGHQTGDALLVETARRFERLSIGDTVIARLGGDEFAVLLRDVDGLCDAEQRMAELARAFDAPFTVGAQAFRLTAAIGLAHNVTDFATTLELVNRADLAMYEAKRRRSVAICLFEPEMEARTRRRIMIEQALATHADNKMIHLNYQPIVDAATNRIVAFEALARWTHPTLGVIPPTEFIPLAEQAGMTEPTTAHLLSMALRAASAWPGDIGLTFNLGAGELASPTLARRILDIVAEYQFDPARLSIEVTETALLSDFAAARSVLGALQAGGVRILLDDFGAGYASIGYLREIQFDGIKLDGSLIASLLDSPAAHDLLVGVLQLCEAIGAPVTAEMVENKAQHDLLRALGVQKLQGHYLSRPLTPERALAACGKDGIRELPVKSSIVPFNKRAARKPLIIP